MHSFVMNGNLDHFGSEVCDTAMGGDWYDDGSLATSQGFLGMCPNVFEAFADSYAPCE
jgi:hypothetical protein